MTVWLWWFPDTGHQWRVGRLTCDKYQNTTAWSKTEDVACTKRSTLLFFILINQKITIIPHENNGVNLLLVDPQLACSHLVVTLVGATEKSAVFESLQTDTRQLQILCVTCSWSVMRGTRNPYSVWFHHTGICCLTDPVSLFKLPHIVFSRYLLDTVWGMGLKWYIFCNRVL